MSEPPLIEDLARQLRRARILTLLPGLIGALIAGVWLWAEGELSVWPLGFLALGAALSAAMGWLQGWALNQRFLPKLAELRGITLGGHDLDPQKLLPEGIVPMGTQQAVLNMVSGTLLGRAWQAGFLECSRRDLQTGSARVVFRGQLVQLRCENPLPDFVLRPNGLVFSHQKRLGGLGLPKAAEFPAKGGDWALYCGDPSASALSQSCQAVLEALPEPPTRAELLGIICANGWIQLICANRGDLFSLWQGALRLRGAEAAVRQVFDALVWAEVTAFALAKLDLDGEE